MTTDRTAYIIEQRSTGASRLRLPESWGATAAGLLCRAFRFFGGPSVERMRRLRYTEHERSDDENRPVLFGERGSMAALAWTEDELASVVFVGESLAPFFLQDPRLGTAGPAFDAMASLDARAAACEWPFVDEDAAYACLGWIQEGLTHGIDDDLVWEYRRLFVGPGHKAAPPWGSVYTDRECVMFGLTTLDLRRWMRERGIERLGDANDPEDHIGLMLELMAWLAGNRRDDLDDYLSCHLLTWAPHFLDRVERETTHAFYKGLACLTRLSLEGIGAMRKLAVDVPRFYK